MSSFRREEAWQQLIRAKNDKKHPFRTPQLASSADNQPLIRTVVLRKVDPSNRVLRVFTDGRSSKIQHFRQNPSFSVLFWYPKKNWQIRCNGNVLTVTREEELGIWKQLPKVARMTYASTYGPGTIIPTISNGLPENWSNLSLEDTDYAFANFTALDLQVDQMDILFLRQDGHQRSLHQFIDEEWQDHWLIP